MEQERIKIVCISDTHLRHHFKIPEGDILIHAGDACLQGDFIEFRLFCEWFGKLPHKYKVFVPGNHDNICQKNPTLAEAMLSEHPIIYLRDRKMKIMGLNFYGSPWQPYYGGDAFNLPRGPELAEKWNKIPVDTDVLITHGPPFRIFDENDAGLAVGCVDLRRAVERVRPKLHVFGHVHLAGMVEMEGTTFVNAAICNGALKAVNPAKVIEIQLTK